MRIWYNNCSKILSIMDLDYDDLPLIIGYVGSSLLIISFLAQLIAIYRSKDVKNISYIFVILQFFVNVMFFIYDYSIWSIPLMIGNGTISILLMIMFAQKIYYTLYHNKNCCNKDRMKHLDYSYDI